MSMDILVVDDILESRRALCAQVSELGHHATGADGGLAALSMVQQRLPDMVLLDLLMPGLDGFEVTRRLRELTGARWVPVIATSSLEGEEHVIHALRSGADDYLPRPVNPDLLQAKLRHYGDVLALQSRLATLAQRQRDILDNILDPVLTLDGVGDVQDFNRSALTLCQRDGQPLAQGSSCKAVFGVEWLALLSLRECTLRRHDGSTYAAELGLSQWHESGAAFHTVVLRDLTERRQVERMKDEFLAMVSHELRTPLTSVLGALGLIAGGAAGALPPAAVPLAEMARRNGERLGRLIDDVLDLTKLEGDRLELHLRSQRVRPLLREALAANQGYAARSCIALLLEEPGGTSEPEVALDADRFLQVMANLLSNAIKHSPAGETVRVALQHDASGVCVSVRDRGSGITPQFRERLFEKFSQADGTDRRAQGGTGLGLYIARMLVERMGGRIAADEVAGEGSAFSLRFPAAQAVVPTYPTVLVVDADYETIDRVARWLSPGYRVEGAATLAHAEGLAPKLAPVAFIGNPQSQGSADTFCSGLRRLAAGRPVLLLGDSIDAGFSARAGMPWMGLAQGSAEALKGTLRELVLRQEAEKVLNRPRSEREI